MLDVRVEPINRETIPDHVALAQTTYSDPTTTEPNHFWWKHGLGPDGPSISVNLYNEDKIVGRSVIMPRGFRLTPATTCRAGLVADLLLEPGHRSALNFISLVRGQPKAPQIDLLVHTSNETSDLLYRKFLRYPVAFNLKAYGIPIRFHNLANKVAGRKIPRALEALAAPWRVTLRAAAAVGEKIDRIRFDAGLPSEDEFNSILDGFRVVAGPHFERSTAFLRWRFQEGPIFNGHIVTVRSRDQAIGYFVWRKLTLSGLEFIILMDIAFSSQITTSLRRALWLYLCRLGIHEGADVVFTMVNPTNPALARLVARPLIPISDSHLPHPTPIFLLPQNRDLAWLQGYGSTYMTLADIDYF
ncbi:hypothetical protein [Microvirga lotononidis]|uniref:Uncharacterized protein n=1 Tax=Microvirga lotononidis TaxID=864069 RepID=I4YNR5_9HYPH|nr:hypothetical protein [Microvirga lotononidis]EIM25607.1 hypothetical protein MicloDRAFT_00063340 [Microvirga lotononidis]WQO26091.1 hypothetical protein U0023_15450 [Microvirga lotononidis]